MTTPDSDWGGRNAWAVIDLEAIAGNVSALARHAGANVRLMAIVKANGYGHGAIPIARTALEHGASELGVATVDEAAELRRAGITAPILVLGSIGNHERARAATLKLGIVATNPEFVHALAADAKSALLKEPVSVHLKVDTGMHRFGATPESAVDVARAIQGHDNLQLTGVMTHFACADGDDSAHTAQQGEILDRTVDAIREAGINIPLVHAANSAATLRFPEQHRDMVRPGIALYGLLPDRSVPLLPGMQPALTIHGRLGRVFEVEPGDTVGYGATWTATQRERLGLIALGYADGYRRSLSGKTWISIQGQRADVVGRISMDQCVVRIPDGIEAAAGEEIVIAGDGSESSGAAPTLDALAKLIDTIGYELATGVAARLPRLYIRNGTLAGISDLTGYRDL